MGVISAVNILMTTSTQIGPVQVMSLDVMRDEPAPRESPSSVRTSSHTWKVAALPVSIGTTMST
jgi:hypothetical protein